MLSLVKRIGFEPGKKLRALLANAYRSIESQDAFKGIKSSMPYCFATREHTHGHAYLLVPRNANPCSPMILLLHGYGGNLLFQIHAIIQELPSAIIVAPSWQIDWSQGPVENRIALIEDSFRAASAVLGFEFKRPWVIGISQGGIAAFEMLPSEPSLFAGMLGISTCASLPLDAHFPTVPVWMAHGMRDDIIGIDDARLTVAALIDRGVSVEIGEVADADHFLLLSHREALGRFVRPRLGVAELDPSAKSN